MNPAPDTFSQGRLPADTTSFVGRRRATTQVRRLLSESRLVTLTGVGGVGKSRLAVRVARELRSAFPDGVWLVELAKLTDPGLVTSAVRASLGVADTSARDPVEVLVDYLTGRRLLLVLDNCEHLLTACAQLVAALLRAAPGLRVLATSREPLGIFGERTSEVPPLTVPGPDATHEDIRGHRFEAVTLFEQRAAAVRPGFTLDPRNTAAVARLCRRLDGLPLAIELAAVWTRTLSVEQILTHLDDRFRLLTGNGTAPARHRTLRAAVEWSFELCSALERLLWARLSVFAGEFDLDAAEAVCAGDGLEATDVLPGIAGLIDKSILVRGPDEMRARYQMLETIRHYGAERLAEGGEQGRLRRRHRDYYLRLAEHADRLYKIEWAERLRAERANVWAAVDYCLTVPGESRTGLRMCGTLWLFWVTCGAYRDGRYWLDRALASDHEPTGERARALWLNGMLTYVQGDLSTSLGLLEEACELARRLDDQTELRYATQYLAVVNSLLGRTDAAPMMDAALRRHRKSEWTSPGLMIFGQRARAALATKEFDLALALLNEGLAICGSLGEDFARSWIELHLGITYWAVGDTENATTHLRESLGRMFRLRDPLGVSFCAETLGWVAASTADMRHAALLFGAADKEWVLAGKPLFGFGLLLDWRDEYRKRCRQALGEQAYETARQKGERLTREQLTATAIGETSRPRPAPCAEPVLTGREREIATMIAGGMSNRDIASSLVIAQRTVEGHVEHILRKLDFGSRSQIAAWIAEHPNA